MVSWECVLFLDEEDDEELVLEDSLEAFFPLAKAPLELDECLCEEESEALLEEEWWWWWWW